MGGVPPNSDDPQGTPNKKSTGLLKRYILPMAFSTNIKGNHHLHGNVQVCNVRIPDQPGVLLRSEVPIIQYCSDAQPTSGE